MKPPLVLSFTTGRRWAPRGVTRGSRTRPLRPSESSPAAVRALMYRSIAAWEAVRAGDATTWQPQLRAAAIAALELAASVPLARLVGDVVRLCSARPHVVGVLQSVVTRLLELP